ncbi:hypothetical protein [Halosegnis marinus]|uniref:MBL fold metallo-hydrolase n=1 Tax=Halosegnis marinus TaxID=3034023 RepID=A0ABD5ZKC6_9EURY|nr:hypothetical protein [Halosegnis sp. DT85]
MPIKGSGSGEPREIDRFDGGVGWLAYPDEGMQRASHALATDEGVWLVDPVDADGVEGIYGDLGEVAGVVLLLDRHGRDAVTFAERHDVDVYAPAWMTDIDADTETEPLGDALADTAYSVERLMDNGFWQEAALFDSEAGTLLVPEAVGTAPFFLAGDERLGVHPMLRLFPPKRLREFDAERVLVGHGAGVLDDASDAIREAVATSRKRAPTAYLNALKGLVS